MSKKEKQLQAMRNNSKNVRYDTISNVLLRQGFKESVPRGGSSHHTFSRDIYRITIPKKNPVNEIYVSRVIEIIDELNEEDEE